MNNNEYIDAEIADESGCRNVLPHFNIRNKNDISICKGNIKKESHDEFVLQLQSLLKCQNMSENNRSRASRYSFDIQWCHKSNNYSISDCRQLTLRKSVKDCVPIHQQNSHSISKVKKKKTKMIDDECRLSTPIDDNSMLAVHQLYLR